MVVVWLFRLIETTMQKTADMMADAFNALADFAWWFIFLGVENPKAEPSGGPSRTSDSRVDAVKLAYMEGEISDDELDSAIERALLSEKSQESAEVHNAEQMGQLKQDPNHIPVFVSEGKVDFTPFEEGDFTRQEAAEVISNEADVDMSTAYDIVDEYKGHRDPSYTPTHVNNGEHKEVVKSMAVHDEDVDEAVIRKAFDDRDSVQKMGEELASVAEDTHRDIHTPDDEESDENGKQDDVDPREQQRKLQDAMREQREDMEAEAEVE